MSSQTKVAIFAGSFDPVHLGHTSFAQNAIKQAELDKVIFLAEQKPRGKKPVALKHRYAMLELATKDFRDHMEVGEISHEQFNLNGTLSELEQKYHPTHFMFGSDVFMKMNIDSWPGLTSFLDRYPLLIALRQETMREEVAKHAKIIGANILIVKSDYPKNSSRNLRNENEENMLNRRQLVSSLVIEYLKNLGLY